MSTSKSLTTSCLEGIATLLTPLQSEKVKVLRIVQLETYWKIGKQLSKAKISPDHRAFFRQLSKEIASKMKKEYSALFFQKTLLFYKAFPRWKQVHPQLSWSHYTCLLLVRDSGQRNFYNKIAAKEQWSSAQLKRQVQAQYYERYRIGKSNQKSLKESKSLLKDLYIFEFLDIAKKRHYFERELEDQLVEKLQYFLMELGEGFAFVARQKRLITATGKQFFVDLVFYHFRLRCFILIELKVGELTPRDVGQLDMYVRMFDEKIKDSKDNPTIGIILCAETDPTIIRYSALHDNPQLHAAQYQFAPQSQSSNERISATLQRLFG